MDKLLGLLPFLVLGALGVTNLVASLGAMRSARRAEELGEERFALLRDQQERLAFLREELPVSLGERRGTSKKGMWPNLSRSNDH